MRIYYTTLLRLLLCGAILALLPDASAQDRTAGSDSRTIVIELDDDGRILVDGEVIESERDVVIRLGDHGAAVRVLGPDDWRDRLVTFRSATGRPHIDRRPGDLRSARDFFPFDFVPMIEGIEAWAAPLGERFEEHADIARMDHEARRLAREARGVEGAERSRLEQELRERLDEIFDRKLEQRRQRVDQIEHELEKQRDLLRQRSNSRQEIIQRRMNELMGVGDDLDW